MKLLNKGRLRLLITDSCNLSCSYCHNEGQFAQGHFMELSAARDLAAWLLENSIEVRNLIISGGEPTIHPKLPDLVAALKPSAEKVSMVTNGVKLDEPRLRELADAGMSYIKFGIDAVDAQTTKGPLDRLPRAASRERVLENALIANEIMPGSHLNTVVSRFNYDRVRQLIEWCDDNRIGVKFLELIDVRPSILALNPSQNTNVHGWFMDLYEQTSDLLSDVQYNPEVMKFYAKTRSGQTVQFSENFCRFGACAQLWTRIDSQGRLVPCIQSPETREFNLGPRGIEQVSAVNQEMRERSKWRCIDADPAPVASDGGFEVHMPNGASLELALTDRTGCVG